MGHARRRPDCYGVEGAVVRLTDARGAAGAPGRIILPSQ